MAIVVVDPVPEAAPPPPDPAPSEAAADDAALGAEEALASLMNERLSGAPFEELEFSLPPADAASGAVAAAAEPPGSPGGAPFPSGAPLDFAFYARQKYPDVAAADAVNRLLQEMEQPALPVMLESVVADGAIEGSSLYTHPCLYADPEAIDDLEQIPPSWLARIGEHGADIGRVLRAVGRIQVHHYVPRGATSTGLEVGLVFGTGVLIAPRIVMTNRHVADKFAVPKGEAFPFRKDGKGGHDPVVLIDFGGVYDEAQNVFRVERVLYMALEDEEPDVALLELRASPGREPPPPAPLQLTAPDAGAFPRDAFAVGYPSVDSVKRTLPLFRLLRVKRVSLGRIVGQVQDSGMPRLVHECTTLEGSSGSALADLQTGTIWGLHFQGHSLAGGLEGNLAEPMWRLAELPAIREALAAAGAAPAVSFGMGMAEEAARVGPASLRTSRPVLFVAGDDLTSEQPFPSDWFAPGSAEHGRLRATLPGVGLVQSVDNKGVTVAAATGFLVGPDLLLTFPVPWQKARKTNKKPGVFVDFNRTIANGPARRFRAVEEVYRDDYLSLLRLETPADRPLPSPLPLQRARPDGPPLAAAPVFLVGHPAAAGVAGADPELATRLFPPPYGVKRVALGTLREDASGDEVTSQIAETDLWHDGTTTTGDAGAPIVSLATGAVLGMHLGGAFGRGNVGVSMWSTLEKPEIRAKLD